MPTARITVRVQPRASVSEITGYDGSATLRVRVTAAPERGRANDAAVKLVANALNVPPPRVTIVRGATARLKLLEISGLNQAEADRRLAAISSPGGRGQG